MFTTTRDYQMFLQNPQKLNLFYDGINSTGFFLAATKTKNQHKKTRLLETKAKTFLKNSPRELGENQQTR